MLTTSLVVVNSLENGVKLSRDRLGADIMLLPAGASGNASEVLFCAEPVNVYLPVEVVDVVPTVPGVAKSTPQFFTQTVNQSCCSVIGVTRVVGIDSSTDFILSPWVLDARKGDASGAGALHLGEDDILLGAAAPAIEGSQASILGSVFSVAGGLEPTGTSVDETIFMDINSARRIAAASPYLEALWGDADPFDAISCVMVKVAEDLDSETVAAALMEKIPGTVAVRTSDMVAGASSQLAVVEVIVVAFLVMLILLAALALAGRFAALASMRLSELGLLRTMGVSKAKVVGSFALEIGLITIFAAVVGIVLGCFVSNSVVEMFHSQFDMPGAMVPMSAYLVATMTSLVFAVVLCAIALVQPITKMLRQDPQETLARGDIS